MSTNPFLRIQRLLPQPPVIVGKVLAHQESDDTSTIELPINQASAAYSGNLQTGSIFQARGTTVPVGKYAFVRAGAL